ncbi:hypothetical protein PCASD_06497 [Puccinia coronata f. sp. avenae]|uniref:Uncharacterized protein n=1 Tax=Puccinia coronata f. sp. avenae TaxID=200324 RepID=A0A2N5V1R9_9BASI|nr:hypothetical protein PCASD_06497 [Puccinia coronata f. sp. avenae]
MAPNLAATFDGVGNLLDKLLGVINWDDYLFEAVNQLSDEPIPREFLPKPPASSNTGWYPFKNKEELSNPYVNPHLDFYPEETHGFNVYKSSQSKKWLKDLPHDLRVQMIEQNNKHYYIFEPTLLRNGHIVIPVFFYHNGPNLMAKCAVPRITYTESPPTIVIQMPLDPSFDLHALKSLNVVDFDQIYDEIKISGLSIGQLCSHQIWG